MFFENFSNPKYLGNTENWKFPINGNFYDINNTNEFPCWYESKMMKMKEPKSSLSLDCYYTENNSPIVFSISFYNSDYKILSFYNSDHKILYSIDVVNNKDAVDSENSSDKIKSFSKEYIIQGIELNDTACYYKIKVNSNISFLKIYGI